MTNPSRYEKNAEEVAEAHSSLGGFIFGTLVELIAIWKDAFKVLSQSFFILNWVNEGLGAITLTTVVCVTILPPLIIGLGSKLISLLGGIASGIAKGWRKMWGMVGPGNRYDFRSGKDIESKDLEKNIIYVDELGRDGLGHQFLSYRFQDESEIVRKGVFKQQNLSTDNLWPTKLSNKEMKKLRPHFDLFATSLLQAKRPTSTNLTPLQPAVPFKPKLNRKTSEILPPCILTGGIPSKALENYHAKERQDYHAHLSAPALQSIEELTAEAAHQIANLTSHPESFFQDAKRQNKIEAIKVFTSALTQWNDLYQNRFPTSSEYHSIILDKETEISRILNPHLDLQITANRKRVIKNIEKYILNHYPDAYQSFYREQGSVATLFQQGFDLMRRMKTEVEINRERELIEKEIVAYEQRYADWRWYFITEAQQLQHEERAALLRGFFNGEKTLEQMDEDPEFNWSRLWWNGPDWQLCERIEAFHDSEKMLSSTGGFSMMNG